MTQKQRVFKWFMMGSDWALLMICFNLAYLIKFKSGILPPRPHPLEPYFDFSLIVALFGMIMLHDGGLYKIKGPYNRIESLINITKALFFTIILAVLTNFVFKGTALTGGIINFSRLVFLIFGIIGVLVIFLAHEVYNKIIIYIRQKGKGLIRLIMVGTSEIEQAFFRKLKANPQFGFNPVGYILEDDPRSENRSSAEKILGKIKDIRRIIAEYGIEEVALSNPKIPKEQVLDIKLTCENLGTNLTIIPNVYGMSTVPAQIYSFEGLTLFTIEERILRHWNKVLKRSMDVILSLLFLLVLSPLLTLVAILIKKDSNGPVFFRQTRLGCGEKKFTMYKFRTMITDAEKKLPELKGWNEADGPIFKMKDDPRVTRIGKILRKYSIDELPQLWHVLMGDMSFVGPRPCLPHEAVHFKPYSYSRFNVKPGITGFAQVNGRSDIKFEERCQLDIYYMENWSIFMDLELILRTIPVVLSGKGSY